MNENERDKITIPYRRHDEFLPVDIEKLRPQGSYENLIKNRNHVIEKLIREYGAIPDALLMQRACPTCGSGEYVQEMHKDHFFIVRCACCNLVYVNPVFNETQYKEVYQSQEYQEIMAPLRNESHGYRVERFGKERVSIMKRFIHKASQVQYLDVGCGTGFVVEAASEEGWDAKGIDLNPATIEFGITERKLNLKNCALEEFDAAKESFDAISLFEVVEHLINPKTILTKAIQLLKNDGILFLYVPNYDSAYRMLLEKEAHFIWPTHHLNYYTPQTISYLLEQLGLRVEFLVTEGLDIVDYMWWEKNIHKKDISGLEKIADQLQFFINAGAYGKNLRIIGRKQVA